MDLIYTNSDRVDQGVLLDYELDLAFGADENNLECRVQAKSHCCESGSLLYIEGAEYGGIIDSIESDTDSKEVIYSGRTWHGIIDSKVLQPDSGEAYLTLNGEANGVIASLLARMDLTDLFAASSEDSGLIVKNYKMNRYITGYGGIIKMLGSVGGKLKMTFDNDKVILSAVPVHDYTQDEEFDADLVPFRAKRNYLGVNHLICLGSGQLESRMVVHLYADKDGNISQEQTQFGLDEVCTIFEYPNINTEEELLQEGMDRFEGMKSSDEIAIDFDADSDAYDVGDIIGAVDNITGLTAHAAIAKKIVTIKNGRITISLSPDTAKKGNSYEVNGGGESSNEPTFAFYPQIIVSSTPGSAVTCSKGDIVLTAEEVNGTWTFNVTDYGEWTVTVSLGGKSNSTTVQVTAVCQMPITILTEFATIFVTGLDESNTVSATKDGKTINGVWDADAGCFAIKPITDYGTWTVTATNGEKTATQDVLVDAAVEYGVEMCYDFYTEFLEKESDWVESGGAFNYGDGLFVNRGATRGTIAEGSGWYRRELNIPVKTAQDFSFEVPLLVSTSDNAELGSIRVLALDADGNTVLRADRTDTWSADKNQNANFSINGSVTAHSISNSSSLNSQTSVYKFTYKDGFAQLYYNGSSVYSGSVGIKPIKQVSIHFRSYDTYTTPHLKVGYLGISGA